MTLAPDRHAHDHAHDHAHGHDHARARSHATPTTTGPRPSRAGREPGLSLLRMSACSASSSPSRSSRRSGSASSGPGPEIGERMKPALRFRNLTLGYDRHPAVHHLDGEVAQGALLAVCGPNGGGKSTLLEGHRRRAAAARRRGRARGLSRQPDRLPAAGARDRPHLSGERVRHGGHGPFPLERMVRRPQQGRSREDVRGHRRRRPHRLREPAHRHAVGRADAARAVRAPAAAGRAA